MTPHEQRQELLRQILQAVDTARALDEGIVAHLLQMALDEAALSAREARRKERPGR